jgi:ribosome-associated protein
LIQLAGNQIHHDEWILIMSCQEERFQWANKEIVTHRFRQLLNEAMIQPKERIKTKVPKQQKEQRIDAKKLHWSKKSQRQNLKFEE